MTGAPADVAQERLVGLYATMVLIRVFEERMLQLRTDGEVIGPVHPYIGQEAIAAGVCQALSDIDSIVSHYRGHGHAIARGVSLSALTAELFGRRTGLCGGKAAALISDPDRNLLISSGIVGAGIPIAAGAAMAAQIRGDRSVAVAFFGDGALGSGVVQETLNIASAQRLPLLFVCENNCYQGATRTEEVFPEVSVSRLAEGHRVHAVTVDGNDLSAVASAADEATGRARAGGGPTFIEARTYLTRFHLQFDTPSTEHRPTEELDAWLARDPILLTRNRLAAAGYGDREFDEVEASAVAAVSEAVEAARSAPWPASAEVHEHVMARTT